MTPEQFARLLDLLEQMGERQYTITGAADWPILVTIGGILIAAIGFMWIDLKSTIKENRGEWRDELEKHRVENEKGHDLIWQSIKDCKDDCCPARMK